MILQKFKKKQEKIKWDYGNNQIRLCKDYITLFFVFFSGFNNKIYNYIKTILISQHKT